MSCESCYNGCVQVTPDECVRYTGPTIPELGITTGDTLKSVEQMITDNLVPLLTGVGDQITLSEGDVCALVIAYLTEGLVHTSKDWITALAKGECDLQEQIDSINNILDTLNADYNIGCLSGVTLSSDTHDVVQAIITKLCATADTLTALGIDVNTNYVKLADLNTLIQAYLDSISGGTTQQKAKMVPFVAYEYYGSLANFDGTGAGISANGFDRVYLCNGANGTPDKRGRVAVGAIVGVHGGALNFNVDPTYAGNPNYALGDTTGTNLVSLTIPQLPSHTHTTTVVQSTSTEANGLITDPGHFHYAGNEPNGWTSTGGTAALHTGINNWQSSTSKTGISVRTNVGVSNSDTGGNQGHANIQPVIAACYIMYIP